MLVLRRLKPNGSELLKSGLRLNSATSSPQQGQQQQQLLVYEGKFAGRLRWLRRVSLGSSVVSIVGFPLAFHFGVGGAVATAVPLVGQFMIAGTAIFTSLSSTLFLQAITSPYVAQLYALDEERRKVLAFKVNLFGNLTASTFDISQIDNKFSASLHPFATFRVENRFYYVHEAGMKECARGEMRSRLLLKT